MSFVVVAALAASAFAGAPWPGEGELLVMERPIGAKCAPCHGVLVDAYRETGMANALGEIRYGELKGLEKVRDEEVGIEYWLHHGSVPHLISESWGEGGERRGGSHQLTYAIGAGRLDRSYVARVGDLEFFAPLEVLSASDAGERRAVLAPGHEMISGLRFTTPITNECLICHTDHPPPIDYPANLNSRDWTPSGISCAACHAQGEEHAQFRGGAREGEDPVVAIDELDLAGRISLCARCHLQGDARIPLSASRSLPEPGEDFLAEWAIYVPREADEDVAFVSQVERMLASVCFTRSLEGDALPLECTTCHDPHHFIEGADERARVREACMRCHVGGEADCSLPKGTKESRDCVDCHMPAVGVFDVSEVIIHDHKIARRPASPASYSPIRVRHAREGDVTRYRWPWEEPWETDPGLEMMARLIAGGGERAVEMAQAEPGALSRRLPTYHHLRGVLLERSGELDEARRSYKRALILDPESGESTVNLSLVLGRMGRPQEGIALLDKLIERHPFAEGALRNRAMLRAFMGDARGFREDLEAAHSILPRAENARALSAAYAELGEEEFTKLWRVRARNLAP